MSLPPLDLGRSNALPDWQRRAVLASAAALLATGLAWLPLHHLWGAGAGELPHPLEPWLLRAHGLAALAGTFALGLVAAAHVGRGLALASRRASGLALLLLAAALVLSGWALWYVFPEPWHATAGWLHAAAGVAAFGLGLGHARGRPTP